MIDRRAEAFDGVAEAYERGRPSYPPAAVDWLARRLDLRPGRTVLDVAAGTGKLTRLLVPTGADVVAVEPVAGMRAELARRVPGVEVAVGTAEATGRPDGSADAVTVGQAFHWFDGPRALAEMHRVLRPGGAIGLVWNRRDLSDPLQAAAQAVLEPLRGDTPSHGSGGWRRAFETTELFGPLEEHRVRSEQPVDEDGLVDRFMSISFVAALPDEQSREVARQLRAIAAGWSGPLVLSYATEVFVCTRRS